MNFEILKEEILFVKTSQLYSSLQTSKYVNRIIGFFKDFEVDNLKVFCERFPDAMPQLYNFLIRIKSQL